MQGESRYTHCPVPPGPVPPSLAHSTRCPPCAWGHTWQLLAPAWPAGTGLGFLRETKARKRQESSPNLYPWDAASLPWDRKGFVCVCARICVHMETLDLGHHHQI